MSKTIIILILLLSSCVNNIQTKGYVPDQEAVELLKTGMSKNDVLNIMGHPSTTSNLQGSHFYYMSTTATQKAFLKSKIAKQNVIAITFDQNDLVTKIDRYNESDAKNIIFSQDFTPTNGDDQRFSKKLFGNVGKFNKKKEENKGQ